MPCRIELSELELMLHIGCKEEERASAQPICVRASVKSAEHFAASRTDELHDTLDAGELRGVLVRAAESARVQTLEKLAGICESALRERFPGSGLQWELVISKPRFGWSYVHAWST